MDMIASILGFIYVLSMSMTNEQAVQYLHDSSASMQMSNIFLCIFMGLASLLILVAIITIVKVTFFDH
jgi:hypothetical protein